MKWVIFTGTWRLTNTLVEKEVRESVREVLARGNGIVTGGATGVDYFCMDEALKLNPTCTKMRIFIPAHLDLFISDYRKNWCHAPITKKDIDALENLLRTIYSINPGCVLEAGHAEGVITQAEYDLRHNEEVTFFHEVYAFQVNESAGTADTINKARGAGLTIALHKKYTIAE